MPASFCALSLTLFLCVDIFSFMYFVYGYYLSLLFIDYYYWCVRELSSLFYCYYCSSYCCCSLRLLLLNLCLLYTFSSSTSSIILFVFTSTYLNIFYLYDCACISIALLTIPLNSKFLLSSYLFLYINASYLGVYDMFSSLSSYTFAYNSSILLFSCY